MSLPPWPRPEEQPGLIPLRPLRIGELLSLSLKVVRRHFLRLGSISLVLSLITSAAVWGVVTATGSLDDYVSGAWLDAALTSGKASLPPTGISLATLTEVLTGAFGLLVVAGAASVAVSREVLGRPVSSQDWRDRLAGRRMWLLLGLALLAAAGMTIGLMILIVPGVLLYLSWFVAAPALVMERSTPVTALRRSALLTRGSWGRLSGLALLLVVIEFGLSFLVLTVLDPVLSSSSDAMTLLISDIVSALLATVTLSWAGAASALAYVDLRMRSENLGPTLAAAAQS